MTLEFKVASHKNLCLRCTPRNVKVDFFINDRSAGSYAGTGSFTAGIGIYGALPGKNKLTLRFSESPFFEPGISPMIDCAFAEQPPLLPPEKEQEYPALHTFQVKDPKDFKIGSIEFSFVLVCPGYFPKQEKLIDEYRKVITKFWTKESENQKHLQEDLQMIITQKERQLREELATVNTESDASARIKESINIVKSAMNKK